VYDSLLSSSLLQQALTARGFVSKVHGHHGTAFRLLQVTSMARQMVVNYGFSDIGPWSLQDPSAQSGDMIMRMMARNSISESLQKRIDDAVRPPSSSLTPEQSTSHIGRYCGSAVSILYTTCC
jgi:cell division protease FtsH